MNESVFIYGKHAVKEALTRKSEAVECVYAFEGAQYDECKALVKDIPLEKITQSTMPKGVGADAVHQGYVARVDASKLVVSYESFIENVEITNDTAFVIMGEIQDPHNVGAIIRSAAALGISAVLIPERRQAQITGTVVKVSAGAAFTIPLVQLGNVNNTIADLKDRGFWVYGLSGDATQTVSEEGFEKPSVLIVGNEGKGIREKTLEHCDIPLRIPISSTTESLNASVAAAIVMHAWSTKHLGAI